MTIGIFRFLFTLLLVWLIFMLVAPILRTVLAQIKAWQQPSTKCPNCKQELHYPKNVKTVVCPNCKAKIINL